MLPQEYNVIIGLCDLVPDHGREVVYGLNATDKSFPFQFMRNVQLANSKGYNVHMVMHSAAHNYDVSLAVEFQNTFPMNHVKME